MNRQQQQVLDSFVRVCAFLDEHPVSAPFSYGHARARLDEALSLARDCAGSQYAAPAMHRSAVARQADLVQQIRITHMRMLVTISRDLVERAVDPQFPLFRMPPGKVSLRDLVHRCDAMIEIARAHAPLLIAHGMPADFLERFAEARDGLTELFNVRATHTTDHVHAREELRRQLRRARLAVDHLDTIVRSAFRRQDDVLIAWRLAKRAHRLGGGAAATPADAPVVGRIETPAGAHADPSSTPVALVA